MKMGHFAQYRKLVSFGTRTRHGSVGISPWLHASSKHRRNVIRKEEHGSQGSFRTAVLWCVKYLMYLTRRNAVIVVFFHHFWHNVFSSYLATPRRCINRQKHGSCPIKLLLMARPSGINNGVVSAMCLRVFRDNDTCPCLHKRENA